MDIHLKELIEELKKLPQDKIVPFGFGEPDCYRGSYEDIAFEPVVNAKVSDMLAYAEGTLGSTSESYKGGQYAMDEYTDCYIAEYDCYSQDKIGMTLISMWRWSLGL